MPISDGGLLGLLRRFAKDRRGVAAIEFGLIMPVMAALWLGTTELTFGFSSDRRVALATSALADLVSRQRRVDDASIDGIFEGARAILYPDGQGTELKMAITGVKFDVDGVIAVEWSEGYNRAGDAVGSAIRVTDGVIVDGEAGCAIVATTELTIPVLFLTNIFGTERTLSHTFAYRPRTEGCVPKV